MKVAAVYARKSNKDDIGLNTQWELCIEQAEHDGYHVPAQLRFGDDDTTGATYDRQGFAKLVELIESDLTPFSRLYIRDVTRLHRSDDPTDRYYYQGHFKRKGVDVRYRYGAKVDPDAGVTADNVGRHIVDFIDTLDASRERHEIRKRTTIGRRKKVRMGFWPSGNVPYGTERWLANSETREFVQRVKEGERIRRPGCSFRLKWATDGTQEVVRTIFRLVDEKGLSYAAIADLLNEKGVAQPGDGERGWHGTTLARIVRNPIYRGDLVWDRRSEEEPVPAADATNDPDGSPIIYRNFMPSPLISRNRWDAVQEIADERATKGPGARPKAKYPLSGLLTCTFCESGWSGHTRDDGTTRYYRHDHRIDCPDKERSYVRASILEEAVLLSLFDQLDFDGLDERIQREIDRLTADPRSDEKQREISDLKSKIAEAESALDRLEEERAFTPDQEARARKARVMEKIEAKRQTYENALQELSAAVDRADRLRERRNRVQNLLDNKLNLLRHTSGVRRKEVLHTLIHRIIVNPNRESLLIQTSPL